LWELYVMRVFGKGPSFIADCQFCGLVVVGCGLLVGRFTNPQPPTHNLRNS
jgi:hypothetical protein